MLWEWEIMLGCGYSRDVAIWQTYVLFGHSPFVSPAHPHIKKQYCILLLLEPSGGVILNPCSSAMFNTEFAGFKGINLKVSINTYTIIRILVLWVFGHTLITSGISATILLFPQTIGTGLMQNHIAITWWVHDWPAIRTSHLLLQFCSLLALIESGGS